MYDASWVDYLEFGIEVELPPPPPPSSLLPLSLPLPFLQPAWFLMVGGDRSFKLALTEKDEEFSDELREDCEVKGDG